MCIWCEYVCECVSVCVCTGVGMGMEIGILGRVKDVLSPHVKDPRLSSRHSVMRDHQPLPLNELLSCERTHWFVCVVSSLFEPPNNIHELLTSLISDCKLNSNSSSSESQQIVGRPLICFLMSRIFTLCQHANTRMTVQTANI